MSPRAVPPRVPQRVVGARKKRTWHVIGTMFDTKVMKFSVRMVSKMGFFLAEMISRSFWSGLSPNLPSFSSITSLMFL